MSILTEWTSNRIETNDLHHGLFELRKKLLKDGYEIETERWQGDTNHPKFLEILHASLLCQMEDDAYMASSILKATQPWADTHFEERVSGIPYNPPPSHSMWLKDTDKYLMDKAFSHSYPERMWTDTSRDGIRFKWGNLDKAVDLLRSDPTTRQCYIPIWFPEDITAACQGERVPCTFGWHFMLRGKELHCSYHMRSCDVIRHLHNDLYFANRLALWMIEKAGLDATPGLIHFSATSLHCFVVDKYGLEQMVND